MPSKDRLDEIWRDDLLERRADATFLIDFLVAKVGERKERSLTRSFVLNIDASWGAGKSYFLRKLGETLKEKGFVVATVNAWGDDHADDPLIAVMSAIEEGVRGDSKLAQAARTSVNELAKISGQVVAAGAKGLVKQIALKYVGESAVNELKDIVGGDFADVAIASGKEAGKTLEELYDAEGKALLEKFRSAKRSIVKFKAQLAKVIEKFSGGSKPPLFVLVDELDRCRPLYAVALLERVKHLFDVDDVIFVMATDTAQLRHSIRALYGSEFDAGRYLLRFFDQTYHLPEPSLRNFVRSQFAEVNDTKLSGDRNRTPAEFCADAFRAFGLNPRDVEQCVDVLKNCVTVWSQNCALELVVLLPLIVAQQQRIVPSYGAELREKLLRAIGKPAFSRWKVDFGAYENGQIVPSDGWKVFERAAQLAEGGPLPHLVRNDRGGEDEAARRLFENELTKRFPQGYMTNALPNSLIREYPNLVRSVGRLSPS